MTRSFAAATLLAGLLLGGGQSSAAENPPAATPMPAPSAAPSSASRFDPNQVICKREENTGSRLGGSKICHTRQEWADVAAQARTNTDRMQQNSFTNGPH